VQLEEKIKSNWNILDGCSPPFSDLKISYILLKDYFPTNVSMKIKVYQVVTCLMKVVVDSENLFF